MFSSPERTVTDIRNVESMIAKVGSIDDSTDISFWVRSAHLVIRDDCIGSGVTLKLDSPDLLNTPSKVAHMGDRDLPVVVSGKEVTALLNATIRVAVKSNCRHHVIVAAHQNTSVWECDLEAMLLATLLDENSSHASQAAGELLSDISMVSTRQPFLVPFALHCRQLQVTATPQVFPDALLYISIRRGIHTWWFDTPGIMPRWSSVDLPTDSWDNFITALGKMATKYARSWMSSPGYVECGGTGPPTSPGPAVFGAAASRQVVCYKCGELGHSVKPWMGRPGCPNLPNPSLVLANCTKYGVTPPKYNNKPATPPAAAAASATPASNAAAQPRLDAQTLQKLISAGINVVFDPVKGATINGVPVSPVFSASRVDLLGSISMGQRLSVRVTVGDHDTTALVDTGASISLVSHSLIPPSAPYRHKPVRVTYLNGHEESLLGQRKVPVTIDGHRHSLWVYSPRSLPTSLAPVVLGLDFLSGKANIDLVRGFVSFSPSSESVFSVSARTWEDDVSSPTGQKRDSGSMTTLLSLDPPPSSPISPSQRRTSGACAVTTPSLTGRRWWSRTPC